ncbi:DUF4889 domain-containing protein [Staphylococcus agnetis]|uniref:DUF4889 domain-containing protein n=1 Tax=Staphylococcus agnetis TaxID=985762 RepID=A0ABD7TX82_9STAP|nr:DUF4889 domain-containing protein [Staphylococcus agnetis]UXU57485.1 DUF4889 domain-containing protein [Staphylococcus agnetis]
MKKLLLGIPFILILIILAYLFVSMYVLNKEEVYYGQVSNDNGLVKTLVSNDSDNTKENFQLTKDGNLNVQKKDFIKIVFTDNGGVIKEQSKIKKSEVPKDLQKHFQ